MVFLGPRGPKDEESCPESLPSDLFNSFPFCLPILLMPIDADLDNLPEDSHPFPAIREIICRLPKRESGPTVNQKILASNLAQREK
jgi:hypothetical protein